MKIISIYFTGALILVLVASCRTNQETPKEQVAWQDEILLQISELRQKQIVLEKEVAEMQSELAEVRSQSGKAETQPITFRAPNVQGGKAAKVAILEFSDFECPYCSRHAQKVFPRLKADYIDKGLIKYGLSDYPLSFHSGAKDAAAAVRCAGEQGKYWEMYSAVFADKGRSHNQNYRPLVNKLDLNIVEFETCTKNPLTRSAIDADMAFGEKLGIDGTPRFIIGKLESGKLKNYTVIKGARDFQVFASAIDALVEDIQGGH